MLDSPEAMKRLIYSPHIYGPSVYEHGYFKDPTYPNNLDKVRGNTTWKRSRQCLSMEALDLGRADKKHTESIAHDTCPCVAPRLID